MDNFRLDITARDPAAFRAAMALAFTEHKFATHYVIRPARVDEPEKNIRAAGHRLIFLWRAEGGDAIPLPSKIDPDGAAELATRWLKEADYGRAPDMDGDCIKGWRLYNQTWGHVDEFRYAVVAVTPAWAMYGK